MALRALQRPVRAFRHYRSNDERRTVSGMATFLFLFGFAAVIYFLVLCCIGGWRRGRQLGTILDNAAAKTAPPATGTGPTRRTAPAARRRHG